MTAAAISDVTYTPASLTISAEQLDTRRVPSAVQRAAARLLLRCAPSFGDLSLPAFEVISRMRAACAEPLPLEAWSYELLDVAGDRALREVVDYELRIVLAGIAHHHPLLDLQRVALMALQQAIMERRLVGRQYWRHETMEGDVFGVMSEAAVRAREASVYTASFIAGLREKYGDRVICDDVFDRAHRLATRSRKSAGAYAEDYGALLTEALTLPLESITSPRYEGRYDATRNTRNWTEDCRRSDILHDVVKALLAELDNRRRDEGAATIIYASSGAPTLLPA